MNQTAALMSVTYVRQVPFRPAMASFLASCTIFLASGIANSTDTERVDAGRELAFDFEKGNCLACHAAPTDPAAITKANIAPPFIAMKERFTNREVLRQQIWDAAIRNPDTIMPPFGRHMILTDDEIELIVDYMLTL